MKLEMYGLLALNAMKIYILPVFKLKIRWYLVEYEVIIDFT